MIHGACGNESQFEPMAAEAMRQGWSTKILTLRQHGLSVNKKILGGLSVLDYVDDVLKQIDKIGRCVVIGHSMGGLIGQKVAEDNKNVKGLILLGSVAPKGILFLSPPALRIIPRYTPALFFKKTWRFTPKHARAILLNATQPVTADRIIKNLIYESGLAGRQCAFGLIPVDPSRIEAKTLVVAGELDRMSPLRVQRKIAKRYWSSFRCLEGSDHMMHCNDYWEECANVVLRWAEKTLHEVTNVSRVSQLGSVLY